MEQPIVIQQSNQTQGEFLETLIESTYRGPVHFFEQMDECRQFLSRHRVQLIYLELREDSEELVEWIRDIPDEVIGMINWEWQEDALNRYLDAGVSDYIFKPYQPERVIQQVKRRIQSGSEFE